MILLQKTALHIPRTIVLIAFLTFTATHALTVFAGGVYRWVDDNGRVHFSQVKPVLNSDQDISRENIKVQNSGITMGNKASGGSGHMRSTVTKNKISNQKKHETKPNPKKDLIAEEKKKRDESLVSECKRRREVYCDKTPDEIRAEERKKAEWQSFLNKN